MNERIKQLWLDGAQSLWPRPGKCTAGEYDYNLEKFAELIVKKCLDIASEIRGEPATDTHYVIGYDRACEKMISGIKEHFGVEE